MNTQTGNTNSFIGNVNSVAKNIISLQEVAEVLRQISFKDIIWLKNQDILEPIATDLKKETYQGERQLEISLITNMKDYSPLKSADFLEDLWSKHKLRIFYEGVLVTFLDGTTLYKRFTNGFENVVLNTHTALLQQFLKWDEFIEKTRFTKFEVFASKLPNKDWGILRFYDSLVQSSEIVKIQLFVARDDSWIIQDDFSATEKYKVTEVNELVNALDPIFYWSNSTSALQQIVLWYNHVYKVSNNILELVDISKFLNELMFIYDELDKLASQDESKLTIHKALPDLINLSQHLEYLTQPILVDLVEAVKQNKFSIEQLRDVIQREKEELLEKISGCTQLIRQKIARIETVIEEKTTADNEKFKGIRDELQVVNAKINNVVDDLNAYKESNNVGVQVLKDSVNGLETRLLSVIEVNDGIKSEFTETKKSLSILKTRITGINKVIKSFSEKHVEFETKFNFIDDTIKSMKNSVDELKNTMNSVLVDIENIKNKIS